ncbi:hypothetical protein GE09DRAFT_979794 [Coniochaeta sp. 2T2.1]|nr:hypothetical protein GE09DRAFT_979794 [Coniochaeta sp. 2T2.1]
MLIPPVSNSPSKVQLSRLGHIYFLSTPISKSSNFLPKTSASWRSHDARKRGYCKDPYIYVALKSKDGKARCGGGAFVAASKEEFQKAAKIPGASAPMQINAPGGGQIRHLRPRGSAG